MIMHHWHLDSQMWAGHRIGNTAVIVGREELSHPGKEPCAYSVHYCTLLQNLPPRDCREACCEDGGGAGAGESPQVTLGSDFLTPEA